MGNCSNFLRRCGGSVLQRKFNFASAIIKLMIMAANSKRFMEMRVPFLSWDGIINLSIVKSVMHVGHCRNHQKWRFEE